MPTYSYHCDACGRDYEEFRLMYQKGPEVCPHCGAGKPRFGQAFHGAKVIGLVKGEPKTFGQAAEQNAKRLGKERMQMMEEAEKERVSRFTGKLPPGAKPITATGETPPWRDGSFGNKPLEKPLDLGRVKDVKKYIETGETN